MTCERRYALTRASVKRGLILSQKSGMRPSTERPVRGLGKETAVKGRIALLASCMTAAAAVAAPVAFAYGSGGGNSSSAPGQAQAIANCNANIDKQVAAGIGPGGGKKEGHTGPTNCDGFFGRP